MSFKRKFITAVGGPPLRTAKRLYRRYQQGSIKRAYDIWARQNEEQCFVGGLTTSGHPLVSIVVPVFNPEPQHFLEMIYSVVDQHYDNWEMVLVNASSNPASKRQVAASSDIDERIKVVVPKKNLGIAGNTNFGLEHCKGDYIAFLDHDDLLHRCALHTVARAIEQEKADIVYTDEDKIQADDSLYFDLFCKPKWSPHLLRCVNYMNHLTVIRAEFVRKVEGLRPIADGAQDYDLLLRVIDTCSPHIVHVPIALYHWRAADSSTASSISTKNYVLKAGTHALQEHLDRNKVVGKAKAMVGRPGFYTVDYLAPAFLTIVIGVVSYEKQRLCVEWLKELLKEVRADFKKAELVIGDWFDPFGQDADVFKDLGIKFIPAGTGNYWNAASALVEGEVVLCFMSGISPDKETHSLRRLVGFAYQNDAIAAPLLLESSGRVLDGGLLDMGYGQEPLFRGCEFAEISSLGAVDWVRNVSNLTMQVFVATTSTFKLIGKNAKGDSLSDVLKAPGLQHKKDDIVLYAHSTFVYRGRFDSVPFVNNTYSNPQLQQVSAPSIRPRVPWWGDMEAHSERDNA